jgi:hypothetical protein
MRPYDWFMASKPIPPDLTNTWQHTLGRWNRNTGHDNLIGLAAKHEQFAWLATRYRDAARSNPEDPVAQARLQKVQRAATIVTFSKTVPVETKTKNPMKGVAILLVGAAVACFLAMMLTEQQVQKQSQTPRPSIQKSAASR